MLLSLDIGTAIAAAVLAQQILYRIREVPTFKFLSSYATGNLLLWVHLYKRREIFTLSEVLIHVVILNTVFLSTLVFITLVRRVFFHPLSKFPGLKLAPLSLIHEAVKSLAGLDSLAMKDLHAKYGDFVRIGPNDLAINNVEALNAIYARHHQNIRGPLYETGALFGGTNIVSSRDNEQHTVLRRIWEAAFSSTSIAEYSPRIQYHVDRLIDILGHTEGNQVEVGRLMSNLAYDIIADLGFGQEQGLQEGMADASFIEGMRAVQCLFKVMCSFRNLCEVVALLPLGSEMRELLRKGDEILEARFRQGSSRKDIFTHLLAKDAETSHTMSKQELGSNAQVILIGGTDTTSSTMSCALRELALHPEKQKTLQAEIDAVFGDASEITPASSAPLPYLNAVVNETLRLWCPIPGGAQYITPPEGVTVDGTFVPGNVNIKTYTLVLMDDERYFPRSKEFIPERWTTQPELVKERRAFVPFSYGAHACVGKNMALNEMRLTLATIFKKYDVLLGESYDEKKFQEAWRDYLTVTLGPIPLRFVPRC